jgi:hypothetical protein
VTVQGILGRVKIDTGTSVIVIGALAATIVVISPASGSPVTSDHAPRRLVAEARHLTAAVDARDRTTARRYATKHVVRSLFQDKHRFAFGGCYRTTSSGAAPATRYPWSCDLVPQGHSNLYEPLVSFRRDASERWIGGYIVWSDAQ